MLKYMTGIDSTELFVLEHAQILNVTMDEIWDFPGDYIQIDITRLGICRATAILFSNGLPAFLAALFARLKIGRL